MTNSVLAETGPLSPSTPMTLIHYGGRVTDTRGILARLKQSEGQLEGVFSESAWQAYTPTPADSAEVQYVRVPDPTGGETREWFVIDRERISGAVYGSIDTATTRYMLRGEGDAVTTLHRDFLASDFSVQDFA